MDLFLPAVGFGLVTASILALAAVGFTLQAGITNIVNLAYGSMLTAAAFAAYIGESVLKLNIWAALIFGSLALGLIAVVINRIFVIPFVKRGAGHFNMMLVTFAVGIILEYIIVAIYGESFYALNGMPESPVIIGQIILTQAEVVIIILAVVVMLATHALLRYTKLGKAMRAMADDKELARGTGINVDLVTDVTWFVSGLLGGLAGVALGMDAGSFNEIVGANFLLVVVAAAVLGGSGKPYGAMIGAVAIGVIMEVSTVWIPSEYKEILALALLVLTVLVRPQGLLGGRGRAVLVR
jgi:branched-chain amino acid transport system permease protein/neutral amino acid transport system permease protein